MLNARPAPGLGPARGLFRRETTAGEGVWPTTGQWALTRANSSAAHRPPGGIATVCVRDSLSSGPSPARGSCPRNNRICRSGSACVPWRCLPWRRRLGGSVRARGPWRRARRIAGRSASGAAPRSRTKWRCGAPASTAAVVIRGRKAAMVLPLDAPRSARRSKVRPCGAASSRRAFPAGDEYCLHAELCPHPVAKVLRDAVDAAPLHAVDRRLDGARTRCLRRWRGREVRPERTPGDGLVRSRELLLVLHCRARTPLRSSATSISRVRRSSRRPSSSWLACVRAFSSRFSSSRSSDERVLPPRLSPHAFSSLPSSGLPALRTAPRAARVAPLPP